MLLLVLLAGHSIDNLFVMTNLSMGRHFLVLTLFIVLSKSKTSASAKVLVTVCMVAKSLLLASSRGPQQDSRLEKYRNVRKEHSLHHC